MTGTRESNRDADASGGNRSFWEARGKMGSVHGYEKTMFAEHRRYTDYFHTMELRFLEPVLRRYPRPRILDQGCGAGRLALALAHRASELIGLDFAQSMVSTAQQEARNRSIGGVRFERRGLNEPIDDLGHFDVVLFSGALYCVDDDTVAIALRQAVSALRTGGTLYLRNNCSNASPYHVPGDDERPPSYYRNAADYRRHVRAAGAVDLVEDRYLFDPLCVPNLLYYHGLPTGLRDRPWMRRALDLGFRAEEATSDLRLRMLQGIYPWVLRRIQKPTAMRVTVALKRGADAR